MPLYEYLCDDCSTKFELRRAMSESDAPTECPNCHTDRVRRQIANVMILTRGHNGVARRFAGGCACGSACGCHGSHSSR